MPTFLTSCNMPFSSKITPSHVFWGTPRTQTQYFLPPGCEKCLSLTWWLKTLQEPTCQDRRAPYTWESFATMAPPSLQLHHVAHPTLHAAAQLRLSKAINSSENALTGLLLPVAAVWVWAGRAAAEPVANIAESADLVVGSSGRRAARRQRHRQKAPAS